MKPRRSHTKYPNQQQHPSESCGKVLVGAIKTNISDRPRDTVLIEKIECGQDGSIIFACTSVESPRAPRVPGRVRAHIKVKTARCSVPQNRNFLSDCVLASRLGT